MVHSGRLLSIFCWRKRDGTGVRESYLMSRVVGYGYFGNVERQHTPHCVLITQILNYKSNTNHYIHLTPYVHLRSLGMFIDKQARTLLEVNSGGGISFPSCRSTSC